MAGDGFRVTGDGFRVAGGVSGAWMPQGVERPGGPTHLGRIAAGTGQRRPWGTVEVPGREGRRGHPGGPKTHLQMKGGRWGVELPGCEGSSTHETHFRAGQGRTCSRKHRWQVQTESPISAWVGVPGCERCRGGREHFQAGQPPTLDSESSGLSSSDPSSFSSSSSSVCWGRFKRRVFASKARPGRLPSPLSLSFAARSIHRRPSAAAPARLISSSMWTVYGECGEKGHGWRAWRRAFAHFQAPTHLISSSMSFTTRDRSAGTPCDATRERCEGGVREV